MRAYKCDRCGDFYISNRQLPNFYITDSPSDTKHVLDLCPKCNELLDAFLNVEKRDAEDHSEG